MDIDSRADEECEEVIFMHFSADADVDTWECGLTYGEYGAITANYVEASYDPEAKSFDFLFEWTVSAGSFGEYPVSIVLSE